MVQEFGRYLVADSQICHGKLTFRGTRVFVSDVLDQVASGMNWDAIIEEWLDWTRRHCRGRALCQRRFAQTNPRADSGTAHAMNLLDENIAASQRVLLRNAGIAFRQIGYEEARKGIQDEKARVLFCGLVHSAASIWRICAFVRGRAAP